MQVAQISQTINVTDVANQVSIEPDSSLNTTVLQNEFVDTLPDDADDITAYLQQVAGSRGAAGDDLSFVIDGFSSGNLPPKDQIQEIRINNNPYSTEFSGIGFGRVEIITRAGTGNFNGSTGVVTSGNVSLSGGTLTAPSTTMNVAGNWSKTGGTFNHNGGTVAFTNTSKIIVATCSGSTLQKWNAPPDILQSLPLSNIREN